METLAASLTWPGPQIDVLRLFVEPTPTPWSADPLDDQIVLFRVVDELDNDTERIAGLEIVGFLDFDRWDALPALPLLWRLPGREPLRLAELLRSEQRRLRQQVGAQASR